MSTILSRLSKGLASSRSDDKVESITLAETYGSNGKVAIIPLKGTNGSCFALKGPKN